MSFSEQKVGWVSGVNDTPETVMTTRAPVVLKIQSQYYRYNFNLGKKQNCTDTNHKFQPLLQLLEMRQLQVHNSVTFSPLLQNI